MAIGLALHILLLVGAALRLTRLATTDTITEKLIIRHLRASSKAPAKFLTELLDCPYCVSVWIAVALVVADHWLANSVAWTLALATLSLAYMVGHVSDRLDK